MCKKLNTTNSLNPLPLGASSNNFDVVAINKHLAENIAHLKLSFLILLLLFDVNNVRGDISETGYLLPAFLLVIITDDTLREEFVLVKASGDDTKSLLETGLAEKRANHFISGLLPSDVSVKNPADYMPFDPAGNKPIMLMQIQFPPDNQNNAVVAPVLAGSETGGGGDGGDPDDSTTISINDDDDESPGSTFNTYKQRIKQARFYNFVTRMKLTHSLLRFLASHPKFAREGYALLHTLLRPEMTGVALGSLVVISTVVGLSAFEDPGITAGRTIFVVIHVSAESTLPYFLFKNSVIGDGISVLAGSALRTIGDNGFAKVVNNSLFIDWNSPDLFAFGARTVFSNIVNLVAVKYLYELGMGKLSGIPGIPLTVLFSLHYPLKFGLVYLTAAGQMAGYPYISFTAGPNPYAPFERYPVPYFCPKFNWVVWFLGCTPRNETKSSQVLQLDYQ